jgi:hypothetical protein
LHAPGLVAVLTVAAAAATLLLHAGWLLVV